MLTGAWITLAYDAIEERKPGIVVFYARKGETTEEFLYLIDYLMHYQDRASRGRYSNQVTGAK